MGSSPCKSSNPGGPDDDSGPEQTRTLDLFSALEFIQLYQAILKSVIHFESGQRA